MQHLVLSAHLATTAQLSIVFSYLVQMAVTPLDHKMPVFHALQALLAHQPQCLHHPLTFASQAITVLGDNSHVLSALRGLLVHQHILMISFCVEKGRMLLMGMTGVSPAMKATTARTQPLIPYHALMVITALHMPHHVILVRLDTAVLIPACYHSSARPVTIVKWRLQLVHHVNQVSNVTCDCLGKTSLVHTSKLITNRETFINVIQN